jgi:hypothetical protein
MYTLANESEGTLTWLECPDFVFIQEEEPWT